MSDYKIRVRNPQNNGWIDILKDINIEVVDAEGNFNNSTLDQVLVELLGLINSKSDIHGGVFFTDVVPTGVGQVVNKVYNSPEQYDLNECTASTLNVTCKLRGITGWTNYKPYVTVNGTPVDITIKTDNPLWDGTVDIVLTDPVTVLRADHEDGAYDEITITYTEAPVIQSALFTGTYPIGMTAVQQTELKEDDTFEITVTTDTPITGLTLLDQGACKPQTFSFPATTTAVVIGTIADRGDVTQSLSAYLYVTNDLGIDSSDINTSNTVSLNNVRPSLILDNIVYPIDPTYSLQQQALKDNESADVYLTFVETTSHSYQFPLSQLNLVSPYNGTYTRFSRDTGGYNIAVSNLTVDMYRVENNTVASTALIINIADTAQTIDITIDPERLVSGGAFGTTPPDNTVTITSNQQLLQEPTIDSPVGTFQGAGFSGGPSVWNRVIHVDDAETKGTYSWQNLETFNLAAVRVDAINTGANFDVGGFVKRSFNVAAWPNRQASIGTTVTDTTKLICTNLSKGLDVGNFTYRVDTTNSVDQYTIINSNTTWYNCDLQNAVSNTTGEMVVELEESA